MSSERGGDPLAGRAVSTGSVFSTLLITSVIEAAAPARRVARLVDVGCGDAPYRHVLAHDWYLGLDRRPRGAGATLVTADAASLPVAGGTADGVLCTEVIEHVPDERALAAELARVAAPGATLVLSAPFVHGLHEQPYDFRRLTSIGLVRTLEPAGWDVEVVAAIGGPVVVAVDGAVRWADSLLRRVARRVAGRDTPAFRALTRPSAVVQRALARAALARGRHLGPIDPMQPSPRLTLGYVVVATRR
jgi:SAM-dependent methyltransferase